MKKAALIPARYASTRFPGKLMQLLDGKSVIRTTYEATCNTQLFDEVFVVCDDDRIYEEITQHGGKAIKSTGIYECGTDRIAAAAENLQEFDLFVNVQGDEPFTKKKALSELIEVFEREEDVMVASLMHALEEQQAIENPNNVKVVVDKFSNALLFSRSVIPYHRNPSIKPVYYKHIGIYAFRKKMLLEFPSLPATPLELAEQLEGMRYLEYGINMKMVLTEDNVIGIDTPEDLQLAREHLQQLP